MRKMNVIDLDLRDYREVWNLQLKLVDMRLRGEILDTLILVEHPHVITLGRRADKASISTDKIPVYQIERGGYATYHGPGQLVGYPIVRLDTRQIEVRRYVAMLEEVIIRTLKDFKIDSCRIEGRPGVWSEDKKIASIGLALRSWVTYHGFALNVSTDLNYFNFIKPCGFEASIMTSIEKILSHKIGLNDVKDRLVKRFGEVFEYQMTPIQPEYIKQTLELHQPK